MQDLHGSGVHSALVAPGFTDTEMFRERAGHDDALMQRFAAMASFGRLATPTEIAKVVLFAIQNPVLNGTVMHANLGQREQ